MPGMTLDEALRWRRDVRHFRTDPVPDETMALLRAAMDLAPSVGNARPWRVLRVVSPDVRAAVRRVFERCNAEAARGYDAAGQQEYAALKLSGLCEAPEHLAVFTETEPKEGRGLGRATMDGMLTCSTAMAIHTLWLAARAEAVGLGWVSILDPAAVETLLRVPESWRLTGYLCLGYPVTSDDTPLLHRVGWQETVVTDWKEV